MWALIIYDTGNNTSRLTFQNQVESGSKLHDIDGDCMINFLISASEAGMNFDMLEATSSSSSEACCCTCCCT